LFDLAPFRSLLLPDGLDLSLLREPFLPGVFSAPLFRGGFLLLCVDTFLGTAGLLIRPDK
jgi:hypothetical protein